MWLPSRKKTRSGTMLDYYVLMFSKPSIRYMFRGKAKQAKLIRKNSVKFRQIGSIYDILEMSMFGRKIYVLFFFLRCYLHLVAVNERN